MDTTGPIKHEEQYLSLYRHLYTSPPHLPTSDTDSSVGQRITSQNHHGYHHEARIPFNSFHHEVPLARCIRRTERQTPFTSNSDKLRSNPTPNTLMSYVGFDQPLPSVPRVPPVPPVSPRAHIPRPPNAFMLFRSDFLKRGVIPSHVERRQQNLSRIAGQCWNLLTPEEKGEWQGKAAKVLVDHQKRNPDYKFTPAPRGSRRPKSKGRSDAEVEGVDGEDRIRQIREEYTQIAGPTAAPARRRRAKVPHRNIHLEKEKDKTTSFSQAIHTPLPPTIPPSPLLLPPEHTLSDGSCLPPFFPQYSVPHVIAPRRPSTSLGFSTPSSFQSGHSPMRTGLSLPRPLSAASSETGLSTYMRDLDITPTAATFGDISMPSTPLSPGMSSHSQFPDGIRDSLPFSALNFNATPLPTPSPPPHQQWTGFSYENDSESLLSSLYANESYPFMDSPLDTQEYPPFEKSYFSHSFPSLEEFDLGNSLTGIPNRETV